MRHLLFLLFALLGARCGYSQLKDFTIGPKGDTLNALDKQDRRYLETLMFGVQPFDSVTYGGVAALLAMTAFFACLIPGRRAMRIDPATALRAE